MQPSIKHSNLFSLLKPQYDTVDALLNLQSKKKPPG